MHLSVTGIILARELGEITEEGRRAKRDQKEVLAKEPEV